MASMGYPLPGGDAFEEELACMILFYPDRAEYRQALFGSLDYLATWIAWERDDDKRGIDAGRAWALAVLATRECIEMNTCENMLALLTQIRDNTSVYCCDVVDISDGDQYTDVVEDGEGDVPQYIIDAGYATGVGDWAGFDDYKCMVSHVMVDNMTAQLEQILSYMLPAGSILGGIPTLVAVASVIFINALSVLVYAIALGASVSVRLAAAIAFLDKPGLEDLIDDMATHHDKLACAIYNADGSDDAIVQLRTTVDTLFSVGAAEVLNSLNIDAQLKSLYSGRHDEQDIAEILADNEYDPGDFSCDCPAPLEAPVGWEWVGVDINYFSYTWNVTRITDGFDAPSSTVTMSCSLNGGSSRWDKAAAFVDIDSDVAFLYGMACRIVSCTVQSTEGMMYSHKPPLRILAGRIGDMQMGVNQDLCSGQAFLDMVSEQADFDISWPSDNGVNRIRTEETPDGSGVPGEYTWVIQVHALRPT